jgi:anti-sigma B factor antagonist
MDHANARRRRSDFRASRTGDGTYDLAGELDISTADVLQGILDQEPAHELTLDAAGLDFLDSSGMRVLLSAVVRGRSVTVRSPSPRVERTLRMAGVDRLPGLRIVE